MRCVRILAVIAAAAGALQLKAREELEHRHHHSHHKKTAPVPLWRASTVGEASKYWVTRAVKKTVRLEALKINAHIKRRAVAIGRAAGSKAAKEAADVANKAAFTKTRALVEAKAEEYCKSISTMGDLPKMCSKEGAVLIDSLKTKGRYAQWQNDADDQASLHATKAAAIAAYRSTATITNDELLPLALKTANAQYQTELSLAQTEWSKIEADINARIAQNKKDFFDKATSVMIAHTQLAVKRKIWSDVVANANKRMNKAAKDQAETTSLREVTTHLAPKFVAAAAHALPIAVRKAASNAMTAWHPHWDGKNSTLPKLPTTTYDWGVGTE